MKTLTMMIMLLMFAFGSTAALAMNGQADRANDTWKYPSKIETSVNTAATKK